MSDNSWGYMKIEDEHLYPPDRPLRKSTACDVEKCPRPATHFNVTSRRLNLCSAHWEFSLGVALSKGEPDE